MGKLIGIGETGQKKAGTRQGWNKSSKEPEPFSQSLEAAQIK